MSFVHVVKVPETIKLLCLKNCLSMTNRSLSDLMLKVPRSRAGYIQAVSEIER